ncbi:hypothetical protein LPB86_16480 [Pedobacter sp. MC2016-14]|nr:hypothetical protein [Pedobacter sp. MC2016-14]MCD0489842.1 hypothetical protein [Pedobacter sp. MC2016-14]
MNKKDLPFLKVSYNGNYYENEYNEKPGSSTVLFFCYFMTLKIKVIT